MKRKHKAAVLVMVLLCTLLFSPMTVFAETITDAQVEEAVASQGKETVTGNVFIWFLCAIAFLKVSQKIDSFMASLGINVGNTGGNMMAELLIAGKGIAGAMRGGGFHRSGSGSSAASPGSAAVGGEFLSGGLAGSVGRQVQRSAVNNATGYSSGGLGGNIYQSSLNKGGDFANQVIGSIAKGDYRQVGSIKGAEAAKAFSSYMGIGREADGRGNDGSVPTGTNGNMKLPSYSNMEIGGGKITGTEKTADGSREFAMYHADLYMRPNSGDYETVTSADGATWYKQYAQNSVERKPYEGEDGKIAYQESIVQKLPPTPQRKDRV